MLTKINTKFKRRLKVVGLSAAAVSALIPLASASATWGPARDTYTMAKPADKVIFNSIIDQTTMGDERNFVRVAEVGSNQPVTDSVKVTPGKEYQVWIYFHNDASSSMNTEEHGYVGIAKGVKVFSGLSTFTINSKQKATISGVVSWANDTNPNKVWDDAFLETDSKENIALKIVEGSATIYNNYGKGDYNGTTLPNALFEGDGTYIGYKKSSPGVLPGCDEYSGHIVYKIKAEQAAATVKKTVSKDGKNFYKTVDAKPGDTLTYKVEFKNTGTMDLPNVGFHDKLPSGVTLVSGTTKLVNSANPKGIKMKDIIGQNGFNTGLYGPGATATLTYKVKVNSNIVDNLKCKARTSLVNTVYVNHSLGELSSSSTIRVTKTDCGSDDPPCTPGDPDCPEDTPPCTPGDPECPEDTPDCPPNDPSCKTTTTPPELPKTGPGEIALAIIAVVCIATGSVYWFRSQKDLAKVQDSVAKGTGTSHKDKK